MVHKTTQRLKAHPIALIRTLGKSATFSRLCDRSRPAKFMIAEPLQTHITMLEETRYTIFAAIGIPVCMARKNNRPGTRS